MLIPGPTPDEDLQNLQAVMAPVLKRVDQLKAAELDPRLAGWTPEQRCAVLEEEIRRYGTHRLNLSAEALSGVLQAARDLPPNQTELVLGRLASFFILVAINDMGDVLDLLR